MDGVPLLRRVSLAVALTGLLSSRAAAQVPLFVPPDVQPEPAPDVPPLAAEPAPSTAAEPLPPPPPAPTPPARVATPPPAKTDGLTPQGTQLVPPEDEDVPADELVRPRRRWYGWQTLTADGASFSLVVAGAAGDDAMGGDFSETAVTMGLVGYAVAPGIVHFAHGNPGRAFASFGMRLGMPLAGAYLGAATFSGCDGFMCEAEGAALGLLLGMGGAIAIDAAVFAYDDAERGGDEMRLMPRLQLAPRRAWIGVGGRL